MAFQAYSCESRTMSSFLRTQKMIHGGQSNVIIPCAVLIFTCCILLHHQFTAEEHEQPYGKFLLLILAQMAPLAVADVKILRCDAPLHLFSVFSEKVSIMGAAMLTLRVVTDAWLGEDVLYRDAFFMLLAFPIVFGVYGVRPSRECFEKHFDVACLFVCMFLATLVLQEYDEGLADWWKAMTGQIQGERRIDIIQNFLGCHMSNMIELGVFMPAMWTMLRERPSTHAVPAAEPAGIRLKSICFFGWLLAFYMFEDIVAAWEERRLSPRVCVARVGHFLLLVDFAAFILGHFFDQQKFDKLVGAVTSWMLAADSV